MSVALASPSLTTGWRDDPDRTVPAATTVERLKPHLRSLGITRLARQTGLDRVGLPCFSAIRPLALTLSVSQGKGVDDASAQASALMEAAELAIAENPLCSIRTATLVELQAEVAAVFNARRQLPHGEQLDAHKPIRWVLGQSWPANVPTWLPLDALTLGVDAEDLPNISRNSNGLASGNTDDEALFHAICELIERDATALWSFRDDAAKLETEFTLASVGDPMLDHMADSIAEAGLELRLFDQTTDLGVPCIMAVIREAAIGRERLFDVAAGYGCHPVGERAIARAITEAAQTRITNIAGARDDFRPDDYAEGADPTTAFLATASHGATSAPRWLPLGTPLPDLLSGLAQRAGAASGIVWASLGGERFGISVLRAISHTLEDREVNLNWRPGARALRALNRR